ncbi:autophagy protein atg9 [Maudiozyma exigua]|uniref:Autophagy-related protein 9 n=1 Tax=Maudiozyma exigua TaxID=34358 RepID=A0A9P6WG28_MAUEX|nr:autophagy protein atg9 [Kazachstania exigua]
MSKNKYTNNGLDDDHGTPQKGQNAFLSRIFGLQSGDVTHSIQDEEMNMYPMNVEHQGKSVYTGNSDISEDDQRIPESDQESSSQEDDEEYQENTGTGEGILMGTSYAPESNAPSSAEHTEMSDVNLTSSYPTNMQDNMGSIKKIGQLSSDEDASMNSMGYEDESADEDAPLFNIPKETAPPKKLPKTNEPTKSHKPKNNLNSKILISEDINKNSRNPFTFKTGMSANKRNKFQQIKRENNMKKSFLVDDNYSKDRRAPTRPTILPNIAMLNKKSLYRVDNLSPTEAALWKWANVENLDVFLQDVYDYYLENGFTCIMLQKMLNLLTLFFVVWISTYLGYCIDYSRLSGSHKLSDVVVDQCYKTHITGFVKFLLWMFYGFGVLKMFQLYFDYKKLKEMHNFYTYLLDITDDELQTIPWQSVVKQLMFLKDQNALTANVVEVKAKNRIDAHDVANRIMRALTKTLEWNINLCVIGFAFNDAGFVKQSFLKPSQREYMIEELQKRFMLAGFLNILLSPFLVAYFVLLYFFRYFNEYKNTPGSIGARQYTPMAEWKFREYNELYHIFKKRLGLSRELSNKYVEQFPREKVNIIMKFIAFISGSFAAILALLTIFDSENFLNFEITQDRTVIFYITILGTIWTLANSSISNEYNVFDPEEILQEVAAYTHYTPSEWKDRYHTEFVKQEFCNLYSLRILILLRELASMVLTPFILWFALPESAERIVDFFRETSIYIDGLGYVCKYAMFEEQTTNDLQKSKANGSKINKPTVKGTATGDSVNYLSENDVGNAPALNKMMQSYMYFIDDYENADNIIGKYQLPNKKTERNSGTFQSNNNYSWKKQFKPGQNPELFAIGKKVQQSRSGQPKKPNNSRNGSNHTDTTDSVLDSFFIPDTRIDDRNNPDMDKSTGVLKLVKDYYKQSDVGR